jgi:gliding motility-associated lipoprotein GldH
MNNKQKLVKFLKKSLIINSMLLISVWVLSCDNNAIFKSYEDLKDTNWYVKKIPSFTFEVKDETVPYNI